MSTLFVIATPIGHREDITLRALRTLREVALVYAEDTRVARKLFAAHGITTPLRAYHQHSSPAVIEDVINLLGDGQDVGIVVDAGTPGIQDPAGKLIAAIIRRYGGGVKISPVPGASALTTIASVAGIPMDRFLFLGFPPHKSGRRKVFGCVIDADIPVILYESSHRILKTLTELSLLLKEGEQRWCVVGRELTKIHEIIYRGTLKEVTTQIKGDSTKGEFVVVVSRWLPK